MKKELETMWAAALRSGKYKQTKGALRTDEGYCCIGVLCDLVDPAGWHSKDSSGFYPWGNHAYTGNIPFLIADEIGARAHVEWLPTLNDRGKTFEEIAVLIEAGLNADELKATVKALSEPA